MDSVLLMWVYSTLHAYKETSRATEAALKRFQFWENIKYMKGEH